MVALSALSTGGTVSGHVVAAIWRARAAATPKVTGKGQQYFVRRYLAADVGSHDATSS